MIFKEKQKIRSIWILLTITGLLTTGIFGIGIYQQIFHGHKFGSHPMSDVGLILTFSLVLLLCIGLFLLFRLSNLRVVIDKIGIEYRFLPFHTRPHLIYWNMIEKYEVIKYDAVKEYGGWGIKNRKNGKAYTVSGDKGLLIYLKTGNRILLGTQKELELKNFLKNI